MTRKTLNSQKIGYYEVISVRKLQQCLLFNNNNNYINFLDRLKRMRTKRQRNKACEQWLKKNTYQVQNALSIQLLAKFIQKD